MISYLSIRNFGLFASVRLELSGGLSVFTGETGAGKSMVVEAVLSCLGQRTSRELLRSGEDRASVELMVERPSGLQVEPSDPLFELISANDSPEEIVLQKDISADRSYLRVNGRIAVASMIQDLAARLVDIHGQQEHHSLLKPQNHLSILDSLGRDDLEPLMKEYKDLYQKRRAVLARISGLGGNEKERQREIDLLAYQVEEITNAKLKVGDEEELRHEFAVLSSQEHLIELWNSAYGSLYEGGRTSGTPAKGAVDEALGQLRKIVAIDSQAGQATAAVEQVVFEMEAAIDSMREYRKRLSVDPARLNEVSERLDSIQRLKSKYGETIERILGFSAKAKERLAELLNADETLAALRSEERSLLAKLQELGGSLTSVRQAIGGKMQEEVTHVLHSLGMPGARFTVRMKKEQEPGSSGYDSVEFMFSANKGESPMPVYKVASGGELSRLMLAIKSHLATVDPVPTLIFDEIDAGIGGNAGQAVAERLWQLGKSHQVLCVSHLPQIAALADSHFLVSKEERDGRTFASVKQLKTSDRALEIARMLSGGELDISLEHAKEMLRVAAGYKSRS